MKGSSQDTKGFTIIEMLACILIILVMASLLLSALQSAREKSLQAKCISNERQILFATLLFTLDEERFPDQLAQLSGKYLNSPVIEKDIWGSSNAYAFTTPSGYYNNVMGILDCPKASGEDSDYSYGYNIYLQSTNFRHTGDASKIVVLSDSQKQFLETSQDATKRHKRGLNAGYADGHVKFVRNIFPYPLVALDGGGETADNWILPPPQVDDGGYTIQVVNIHENEDGTITITTNVTSDGDEDTPALSHISFGPPECAIDMAADTARSGRDYTVEIVTPDPKTKIIGIKFDETSLGEDGAVETEFFEFEVPGECVGESFDMTVGTKSGRDIGITIHLLEKE